MDDTLVFKIEYGRVFLRCAGNELKGVSLLPCQLEEADDAIKLLICGFLLSSASRFVQSVLVCLILPRFFPYRLRRRLLRRLIVSVQDLRLTAANGQYRLD